MAKKALIVLAEGFEEIEAVAPIDLLRRAGIELTVAGLSGLSVKSARGLQVSVETVLSQAPDDFDALVLPGGAIGAKNLAASDELRALILRSHKKDRWICAICASPVLVLDPLGILRGKSATCYKGMESSFSSGVRYEDRAVVVDRNVVTSQGPATAVEFALAVAEKLAGLEASRKVRAEVLA